MLRWPTRKVENTLRRILFLAPYPDDMLRPGVKIIRTDHAASEIKFGGPDAVDDDHARYQENSRRAYLAARVARVPHAARRALTTQLSVLRARRDRRRILRARKLLVSGWHLHTEHVTEQVEAVLTDPASGARMPITINAAKFSATIADDAWCQGEVARDGAWTDVTLTVPADSLDDDIIREAVTRWWMSEVEYLPRHWATEARQTVQVTVDLAWQTPVQDAADRGYHAIDDNDAIRWLQDRSSMRSHFTERARTRWRRFGRNTNNPLIP